jgi:DNA-binding response OmpR family regulator
MVKKVLIIEDEEGLAEEWEVGFKYEGYDTQIVTNMNEMVVVLDHLDFDLVILDTMLPTINTSEAFQLNQIKYGRTAGVWCAKQIKKRRPDLPIIGVTVVTDEHIIRDLIEAGVNKILNKPCTFQDILETVKLLYND